MFHFSTKSKNILNSVNPKLQKLFNEVIKYYDISIISGFRTVEEQQELFKQNRSRCDGINKISKQLNIELKEKISKDEIYYLVYAPNMFPHRLLHEYLIF